MSGTAIIYHPVLENGYVEIQYMNVTVKVSADVERDALLRAGFQPVLAEHHPTGEYYRHPELRVTVKRIRNGLIIFSRSPQQIRDVLQRIGIAFPVVV